MFPALVLAALRFGERGATLAVAIAAGFTVWNTSRYDGPFVISSVTDSVVNTQLFIAVAALTTFCLAAVVAEREAIGEDLRASRARLVEASDTERRKLVRDLHDGAQQRLSALAVHLRLAADDPPPPEQTAALIVRAGDELTLAIEELRELAHGLPPALLAKLGPGGRDPQHRRPRVDAGARSWSCRPSGSTTPPRRPRTTSSPRRSRTRSATRTRARSGSALSVSPHACRRRRGRRRRRRRERGR